MSYPPRQNEGSPFSKESDEIHSFEDSLEGQSITSVIKIEERRAKDALEKSHETADRDLELLELLKREKKRRDEEKIQRKELEEFQKNVEMRQKQISQTSTSNVPDSTNLEPKHFQKHDDNEPELHQDKEQSAINSSHLIPKDHEIDPDTNEAQRKHLVLQEMKKNLEMQKHQEKEDAEISTTMTTTTTKSTTKITSLSIGNEASGHEIVHLVTKSDEAEDIKEKLKELEEKVKMIANNVDDKKIDKSEEKDNDHLSDISDIHELKDKDIDIEDREKESNETVQEARKLLEKNLLSIETKFTGIYWTLLIFVVKTHFTLYITNLYFKLSIIEGSYHF